MPNLSPQKHVSRRDCLNSRRSRIFLATVALIVILAAVIPPVVVTTLRQKNSMGPKSKVFVPLYIYPAPGAWTPLEEVYVSPFHSAQNSPSRSPSTMSSQDNIPSQAAGKTPSTRQGQCHAAWAPITKMKSKKQKANK